MTLGVASSSDQDGGGERRLTLFQLLEAINGKLDMLDLAILDSEPD